jgi:hypothetical protein
MVRRNEFTEIISSIFAIIVFVIIGSIIIGELGDPIGLSGIFSFIFVVGGIVIVIALLIKILKFINPSII